MLATRPAARVASTNESLMISATFLNAAVFSVPAGAPVTRREPSPMLAPLSRDETIEVFTKSGTPWTSFSRSCADTESVELSTAPITAIPRAAPIWRRVLFAPDPAPSRSEGISLRTMFVSWAMARPTPTPYPRRTRMIVACEVSARRTLLRTKMKTASISMPAVTTHFGPNRAEKRPAVGATNSVRAAKGRNVRPVARAV